MNKRIKELEDAIILHKNLYYQGKAKISDETYDQLEIELKNISPNSSVLQMVGATPKSSQKIKHDKKMLSLEKTYDEEKLKDWMDNQVVLSTFKYDGSACSLVYHDGALQIAKTRGDGQFGENILNKVIYIDDIPKRISHEGRVEIRGEIYCTQENFIDLTKEMEKNKLDAPTSLRNIVAGLLGRKDHQHLAKHLSFTAFELILPLESVLELKIMSEERKFERMKKWGFILPDYAVCKTWDELKNQITKCQQFFGTGDFLVDGLVISYNDSKLAEELGETSHHPKNKIAFKFQGVSKISKIVSIEWNISRNGRCTPVAIIEPVELSGVVVSRVTLHHYGMVEAFKLMPGVEIEIVRSGEVIPKFLRVVKAVDKKFTTITHCPSCKSPLVIDSHWLKCINPACPQKKEQEILYFVKSMGIEEISEMRLREMINKGLVSEVADLFKLTQDDFLKLDKVKEKLAIKFFEQIQNAKKVNLVSLISSLGIEGFGETKIQKIIDAGFDTVDKILEMKIEEIQDIAGFAEKSSQAIIDGLKDNKALIKKLLKAGIIIEKNANARVSEKLKGMKFCITGTLSKPRDAIALQIKMNAGVVQDTVNKETSYLVTNDKESSSSKFVKAVKLGIKILNEDQLDKLIK